MKIIIHEDDLKQPEHLAGLYGDILSIVEKDGITGKFLGKFTDVTGTRIEAGNITVDDAARIVEITRMFLS